MLELPPPRGNAAYIEGSEPLLPLILLSPPLAVKTSIPYGVQCYSIEWKFIQGDQSLEILHTLPFHDGDRHPKPSQFNV